MEQQASSATGEQGLERFRGRYMNHATQTAGIDWPVATAGTELRCMTVNVSLGPLDVPGHGLVSSLND